MKTKAYAAILPVIALILFTAVGALAQTEHQHEAQKPGQHDMSRMDESKHAERLAFDRCSPGTFAFSDRKAAEAFVAQNGGVLRSLTELLAEAQDVDRRTAEVI